MASPWDALTEATGISGTDEPTTSEPLLVALSRYLQGGGVRRVPITEAAQGIAGSTQIAKVAPQIGDPGNIARALRSMGREALNYMRKTGQTLDVVPGQGSQGSMIRGVQKHVMTLSPRADEATPFHEAAHLFENILPPQTKAALQAEQEKIPSRLTRMVLRSSGYSKGEVPGEAFAYAKEPAIAQGAATQLSKGERAAANTASRGTRKNLKEIMRQAFEDEPAQVAEEAAPRLRRNIPDEALADVATRNKEEAESGFAALMAKQPWDVQEQARLEHMDAIIRRMKRRNKEFISQKGGD